MQLELDHEMILNLDDAQEQVHSSGDRNEVPAQMRFTLSKLRRTLH